MEKHSFHLGNPGDGNCWEITVTEGGLHIRLVPCQVSGILAWPLPDGKPEVCPERPLNEEEKGGDHE